MDSAKIVVGEVEPKRGSQVVPLLRKGVGQARESPHRRTDAEVTALNY